MRDRRFIAAHRGGPLSREDHILLARWAADVAERVQDVISGDDDRPRHALETVRAWADGEVQTGACMKASVAAHAAAREAGDAASVAAARAAGHAVATAHFADHCMGALLYAMKAMEAAGIPSGPGMDLRLGQLPVDLREMVSEGVRARIGKFGLRWPTAANPENPKKGLPCGNPRQ